MDDTRTPPPTPPAPYIGAGAQLPDVDPHHHAPPPEVDGEAGEVYGDEWAHAIQQAPAQFNFMPQHGPIIAIHEEQWVPGPDDVLDLLDAGDFPQQGVFDMNMQPLQLPQPPFAFQQLNPLEFEEDLDEEPWVPGEDDVLDLDAAEPHALFAQLHINPNEEEEEFNEEPWVPGPEDVLDLDDDGPQPPLAPPHLDPVIEMIEAARAALAAEPIPDANLEAPQGSPENEAGPLPVVNEAPAHGIQAHQALDEVGEASWPALPEAINGLDVPVELLAQPEPLPADVNGVTQVGGAGISPAGPVAGHNSFGTGPFRVVDGDGEHPVAGQGLQLPAHILDDMADLAAEFPPTNNFNPNDLHVVLRQARIEIRRLKQVLRLEQEQPVRSAGFIRNSLETMRQVVDSKRVKHAWKFLSRKVGSMHKQSDEIMPNPISIPASS